MHVISSYLSAIMNGMGLAELNCRWPSPIIQISINPYVHAKQLDKHKWKPLNHNSI